MQVVFYGTEPGVGTSANMQLAAFGTAVLKKENGFVPPKMQFFDCSKTESREREKKIRACDLFAVNISLTPSGLENFFLHQSFVQKNIIFLIGKYYHYQKTELQKFARDYRISPGRICPIPYNQRFKAAYESGQVLPYLKWQQRENTLENSEFLVGLKKMIWAMEKYADRKGELNYG